MGSKRGFASMSPERQLAIAQKGGASVKAQNRSFSRDPELASRAGSLGGKASHAGGRKPKVLKGLEND
jgi:uncharacterized protein